MGSYCHWPYLYQQINSQLKKLIESNLWPADIAVLYWRYEHGMGDVDVPSLCQKRRWPLNSNLTGGLCIYVRDYIFSSWKSDSCAGWGKEFLPFLLFQRVVFFSPLWGWAVISHVNNNSISLIERENGLRKGLGWLRICLLTSLYITAAFF